MSYVRKTADEYQLHVKYSGEWEEVTAATTRKAIIEHRKEYRANDPYAQDFKIIKKRVPVESC